MVAVVRGLYLSLLGREPDVPGLEHWVGLWENGMDLSQIARKLFDSEECTTAKALQRWNAIDDAVDVQTAGTHRPPVLAQTPVVIVDVGAQNLADEEHIYASLGRQGIPCRVIGFEPLEHRRLERSKESGNGVTLLPNFIGDGQNHTFYINEPDATSSLLPFNRTVIDRLVELAPLRTVSTESAATTTLDEALVQEPHIDLLKLDIQGFELPALKNAQAVLQRTLVVHCEVSFVEIYKGQALFSEVEQHMRSLGFDLVDFSTLCRYPVVGTRETASKDWLGWGDAVFLRRLPVDATWRERLVQSLIALVVYHKISLAAWLARDLSDTPAANYFNSFLGQGST